MKSSSYQGLSQFDCWRLRHIVQSRNRIGHIRDAISIGIGITLGMQSQMQYLQYPLSLSNSYEPVEPGMPGVAIALAGELGPVRLIQATQQANSRTLMELP